ncbi:MAG: tRNA glutamyl-Q(34) synthetase GluQRS [Pseudomonadota bacterium]|jgi:glutamyl-Q tRNA(Asp) synthetase|nr:tRNA glutamyl-Q(34) synthetase GluQRS [Pseudomonadota bacterium]
MTQPETTRFAPSPTGGLHLGHAWSALLAHAAARDSGGRFLLRIEDIDAGRCRPEYTEQIIDELKWLEIDWDGPVRLQSGRMADYRRVLADLTDRGLTYPCFCTRRDIADEIARMQSAPHGPEGPLYPGTCRTLDRHTRDARLAGGTPHAIRLDVAACLQALGAAPDGFLETGQGPDGERGLIILQPDMLGDIVLGRRDVGVSYHLAVVIDDHDQGVTLVTRGEDLFAATHVQRLLQAVLGLGAPRYRHHPLIRDASGRRLAKRDQTQTLAALRASGVSPAVVRARLRLNQ